MAKKVRWQYQALIGRRRVYARISRSEIIVRVENDGDTAKWAEYGYPKYIGIISAAEIAAKEVEETDIKE